jgi:hypothetical protein
MVAKINIIVKLAAIHICSVPCGVIILFFLKSDPSYNFHYVAIFFFSFFFFIFSIPPSGVSVAALRLPLSPAGQAVPVTNNFHEFG